MLQDDEAEELEVEPDWHQVTALQVLSSESSDTQRAGWMGSSFALVLLLTLVTTGILHGIDEATCLSQSDCFNGYWCSFKVGTCTPCHDFKNPFTFTECNDRATAGSLLSTPSDRVGGIFGRPRYRVEHYRNKTASILRGRHAVKFGHLASHEHEPLDLNKALADDEFDLMCGACYNKHTGAYVHFYESVRMRIRSMKRSDWATVVLAVAVAVMTIIKHVRDIRLFDITWARAEPNPGNGWIAAMWLLSSIRQFAFLPMLLMTVPHLVATGGGGALKVCLDTVGVLFVLELGSLMTFFMRHRLSTEKRRELDAQVRRSMVSARGLDGGKVGHDHLAWSERIHFCVLWLAVLFQLSLPLWVESPIRYWIAWWLVIPSAFLAADFAADVGGVSGTGASALLLRLGRFFCGIVFLCLGVEFAGVDDLRSFIYLLVKIAQGEVAI